MARPKIYSVNEDYFNSIDTREKAYILGFLYADGSVGSKNACISITLSSKDVEVLEFIKGEIEYSGPIRHTSTNGRGYCHLSFNSMNMKKHLMLHGIVPNKTYNSNTLPICPEMFYGGMLAGLFDGDGSIWKITHKSQNSTEYCVNFSNNDETLGEIKQYLANNGVSSGKIRYRYGPQSTRSCMLDIKGRNNIESLMNLMYLGSTFKLQRKFSVFVEFLSHSDTITKKYTDEFKKSIIVMYNDGMSQAEICAVTGKPHSSIRGVIQRARRDGAVVKMVDISHNDLYLLLD